jgi:lipopolysaccharide export LptBFGC system permease protein LptF
VCFFFLPFFSCFLAFFCCSFCSSFLLILGAAVSVRGGFGDPNLWYNFLRP